MGEVSSAISSGVSGFLHSAGISLPTWHTGATVTIIFLIVILLNDIRKTEKRLFSHQAYECMPPSR
jgi:hypothetical protein